MNRRSRLTLPALLLVALAWATTTAKASDQPQAPGAPIVGSWQETTTIPGGPPPFAGLLTFNRSGTVIASYQGSVNGPTVFTAAHGEWIREGARTYVTTTVQLVSDQSGSLLFINRLRQRIVLSRSGDSYTSAVRAEMSDPATGTVFFVGEGTTAARRIRPGV